MIAVIKISGAILYAFMAWVAVSQPLTLGANICTGVLFTLSLVHLLECWLFRKQIAQAPGSKAWHMLNVFLYGILHIMVLKEIEGRALMAELAAEKAAEGNA